MQCVVTIGEKADFERFEQVVDIVLAAEQGGDDDQGLKIGGNALGKIHLGQRVGRRQQGGEPVHQCDSHLAGRYQCDAINQYQQPGRQAAGVGNQRQAAGDQHGNQ